MAATGGALIGLRAETPAVNRKVGDSGPLSSAHEPALRQEAVDSQRVCMDAQRRRLLCLWSARTEAATLRLQTPIVGVGTHDAFNAVQTDPQLANRFEPVVLRRWMTDDYLRLLASFEVAFPLERVSGLTEVKLAQQILRRSEGTIDEISALLTFAAPYAIECGAEQMASDVLDACGYVSPRERRRSWLDACRSTSSHLISCITGARAG